MKSYTDLEQSRKLAEILPLESADMYYALSEDESINMINFGNPQGFFDKTQVAWSLTALLSVIPKPDLVQNSEGTWLVRSWVNAYPWSVGGYSNPIDAVYGLVLKLNKLKLL